MAASIPIQPGDPSLCNMPTEIRLEIFNHLLSANNIPSSYGYTGPKGPSKNNDFIKPPPRPPHRHAVLFVSQQFSEEYRQCYYERTTFFLRVDAKNAFGEIPTINRSSIHVPSLAPPNKAPNFWYAPHALLRSLRNCTLYIELGDIASDIRSSHSVSLHARKSRDQLKAYGSLADVRIHDSLFDSTFVSSILQTLPQMQQLRSVQLVWDTNRIGTTRAWKDTTNWTWETLGEPIVEYLKDKGTMRDINVKVGDQFGHVVWKGKREEGKWQGDLTVYDISQR